MGWSGSWLLISVVSSCRKSAVVRVFEGAVTVGAVTLVPVAAEVDVTEVTEDMERVGLSERVEVLCGVGP